jgi:hypothetical protein
MWMPCRHELMEQASRPHNEGRAIGQLTNYSRYPLRNAVLAYNPYCKNCVLENTQPQGSTWQGGR